MCFTIFSQTLNKTCKEETLSFAHWWSPSFPWRWTYFVDVPPLSLEKVMQNLYFYLFWMFWVLAGILFCVVTLRKWMSVRSLHICIITLNPAQTAASKNCAHYFLPTIEKSVQERLKKKNFHSFIHSHSGIFGCIML